MNSLKIKDVVLAAVVSTLVGGSLALAVIDEEYRPTFADLAKVGVGTYIGLNISKNNNHRTK